MGHGDTDVFGDSGGKSCGDVLGDFAKGAKGAAGSLHDQSVVSGTCVGAGAEVGGQAGIRKRAPFPTGGARPIARDSSAAARGTAAPPGQELVPASEATTTAAAKATARGETSTIVIQPRGPGLPKRKKAEEQQEEEEKLDEDGARPRPRGPRTPKRRKAAAGGPIDSGKLKRSAGGGSTGGNSGRVSTSGDSGGGGEISSGNRGGDGGGDGGGRRKLRQFSSSMFRGRVFVVHGTGLEKEEEARMADLVARCVPITRPLCSATWVIVGAATPSCEICVAVTSWRLHRIYVAVAECFLRPLCL